MNENTDRGAQGERAGARTSKYVAEGGRTFSVGEGAVRQQGTKELYVCNACGGHVVWLTSKRTGKMYLANAFPTQGDGYYYVSSQVHKREECAERAARIAAMVDGARS